VCPLRRVQALAVSGPELTLRSICASPDDPHHRCRVRLPSAQLPSPWPRRLTSALPSRPSRSTRSGFLGQRLLTAITAASSTVSVILTDIRPPPIPAALRDSGRITAVGADLADAADVARLLDGKQIHVCYAMHGLMSGGSEADFELGYRGEPCAARR